MDKLDERILERVMNFNRPFHPIDLVDRAMSALSGRTNVRDHLIFSYDEILELMDSVYGLGDIEIVTTYTPWLSMEKMNKGDFKTDLDFAKDYLDKNFSPKSFRFKRLNDPWSLLESGEVEVHDTLSRVHYGGSIRTYSGKSGSDLSLWCAAYGLGNIRPFGLSASPAVGKKELRMSFSLGKEVSGDKLVYKEAPAFMTRMLDLPDLKKTEIDLHIGPHNCDQ